MKYPELHRPIGYYCFLLVAALGIFVSTGLAADDGIIKNPEIATGFLDQLSDQFEFRASIWEEHFRTAAKRVFRVLLIIDFAYVSFDVLFLKGEDIRTWAGEILRQVLVIGFFSWMLFNSGDAVPVITEGFGKLAGIATGLGEEAANKLSSPSSILHEGFKNGAKVSLDMMGIEPGSSWQEKLAAGVANALTSGIYNLFSLVISGAVMIIYAMIACRVLITQIETFVSLSCGVVVLAFGGSRWTREPAIRYCWFLMALALKLFTIYMVVSLGSSIINDLFINAENEKFFGNITAWFMMIGCLAIWLVILWVIPNSVAQLVSHIGGVGGGGAAGTSAAAGLIGGSLAYAGSAVSTAVKAAGVAAAPAGGAGLAVTAAVAAGEKAMQMGVGAVSAVASQAGGAGQGGSGGKSSLGGIASKVGPGSTSSAISSGQSQTGAKAGSSTSGGAGGAAAGSMATSAATTALGGIAKGVTGTMSGAASLGATGTLNGQRASSSPEISSGQQREAIKRSSNLPKK